MPTKTVDREGYHAALDASKSEAAFQAEVIAEAHRCGWRVTAYRPAQTARGWRTAVQGDAGGPDLLLARGGVVWCWELKSAGGYPDREQRAWGLALGASYRLLRPRDWAWIQEVLT